MLTVKGVRKIVRCRSCPAASDNWEHNVTTSIKISTGDTRHYGSEFRCGVCGAKATKSQVTDLMSTDQFLQIIQQEQKDKELVA